MQTPYVAGPEGVLEAVLPGRCPFSEPGDEGCALRVDHVRERKTGPGSPLAVVRCARHPAHAFTLYPPGHVPYGRVAAAPASTSGTVLLEDDSGQPAWEATLFGAVQEVAAGERWPEDHSTREVRRTQGRRLQAAGRLTGAHPELDERAREQIATRLGVPMMTLRAAAQTWVAGGGWTARARAVLQVVDAMPVVAALPERVLSAGVVGELWPPPRRWEQASATLRGPFRGGPSPSPLGGEARAPPATSSRADRPQ